MFKGLHDVAWSFVSFRRWGGSHRSLGECFPQSQLAALWMHCPQISMVFVGVRCLLPEQGSHCIIILESLFFCEREREIETNYRFEVMHVSCACIARTCIFLVADKVGFKGM